MTTRIQCPWVPSVHHRVPRQAVDAERDLQLVPKHLLLLQAKRCHLEGTVQFPFFSLSLCATIYFSVTNHVEKICVSRSHSIGRLDSYWFSLFRMQISSQIICFLTLLALSHTCRSNRVNADFSLFCVQLKSILVSYFIFHFPRCKFSLKCALCLLDCL
jgi:cytochrome bd-type quinol oxidase subunit 2